MASPPPMTAAYQGIIFQAAKIATSKLAISLRREKSPEIRKRNRFAGARMRLTASYRRRDRKMRGLNAARLPGALPT
jgi:hypothetical protein